MAEIFTMSNLLAVAMLALMEIVLGIDNIVFIAILSERLRPDQQSLGRKLGLAAALVTRLGLLFTISWIMGLTKEIASFSILNHHVSLTGQSIVLLLGGLFLIYKASHEIYVKTEVVDEHGGVKKVAASLLTVVIQIALIDIVFSLDSIITAVGMVGEIPLMVTAIIIAMAVMIMFADRVSKFISDYPTIKMLALAFLLLIGVLLTAEAFEYEIPRGYVYFAMLFAMGIQLLEIRRTKNHIKHMVEGDGLCPTCGATGYHLKNGSAVTAKVEADEAPASAPKKARRTTTRSKKK